MKTIRRTAFLLAVIFLSCNKVNEKTAESIEKKEYTKFHEGARAYCKAENFNEDYYFLINLGLHSGKNRFFIYDFKSNKVTDESLIAHGSCDQLEANPTKWEKAKFSNTNNSHCSSQGKYKIGRRDYSSWGIKVKYWLHGLEASNANAVKRVVVLHSWEAVANEEIYPEYSPLSWGCPAVSDSFMEFLDVRLKHTPKPVLLWIIE